MAELQQAQRDLAAHGREHGRSVDGDGAADPSRSAATCRGRSTGDVTERFGRAPSGRFGTTIVRNGIEVAATEGTTVAAVHEGTVAYAAPFTGFGTLVIVDHGQIGIHVIWAFVGSRGDAQGRTSAVARPSGTLGQSPSGGAALYFEVRIDGRPVDPLQWLEELIR